MTGGVNIVLIGLLDGMEMVPHLSLVLIAYWYLVANDRRRQHCPDWSVGWNGDGTHLHSLWYLTGT